MDGPRLRDVAERAGVSMATASYVLRDSPSARISPVTRTRVRLAADDLGYRLRAPHPISRGVVLVASEHGEQIAPGLAAALTEVAWARGLATVLLPRNGGTARDVAVAVREQGLRTLGIVRVADGPDVERGPATPSSVAPTVVIDLTPRSTAVAAASAVVVPDDRQAARQVAAALQRSGHHRIALAAADRHAHLVELWRAGLGEVLPGRIPVVQLEPAPPRTGRPAPVWHADGHDSPTALIFLGEPAPASVGRLANRSGRSPHDDVAVLVRGGAGGPETPESHGYLRVPLPVTGLAHAALEALDRSVGRAGPDRRTPRVTRVRFPVDPCWPALRPFAARAHLHVVETRVPAG